MNRMLVTLAVASTVLTAAAWLQPAFAAQPTQVQDTALGPVLADGEGLTLYTFDKDANGQSACNDQCADNWPPYFASDADEPAGDFTLIARPDGSRQWAYKGKPLYQWTEDSEPGDTKGDGKNGVWHVARP